MMLIQNYLHCILEDLLPAVLIRHFSDLHCAVGILRNAEFVLASVTVQSRCVQERMVVFESAGSADFVVWECL